MLLATNIYGTVIPLEFRLNHFAPDRDPKATTNRFLIEQYDGKVVSVDLIRHQALAPKIFPVRGMVIFDYRFVEPRYPELCINWIPVSGSWPSVDRPEIPDMLRKAKLDFDRQAKMTRLSNHMRRTLAFAVLISLIALPFIFAAWRSRKHKTSHIG